MKWKKEQIVLVSIIVLLAAYLAVQKGGRTHYALPQLPKIEQKEITHLTLTKAGQQIDLQKNGDAWTIEPQGYPADRNVVDNLLGSVAGLSLTALVSEDGGLPAYDLDPAQRIEVQASAGKELRRSFFVGKAAPSGSHTFVQLDREKGVFHADGDLREVFDANLDRLRDKTVMKIDGDVQSIVVEQGRKKLAIAAAVPAVATGAGAKDKKVSAKGPAPKWMTAAGKPANDQEVDSLVSTLRDLQCDGFLDGKLKKDLTRPLYTVTVQGPKTYTLALFKDKERKDYYDGVSSECAYPFQLSGWRARQIMKDFSVLTGTN